MIEKIQNIYTKICLAILKNINPFKKLIGRSNSREYIFYIKHIINITVNGLSWKKLGAILELDIDFIRKKYNKWIQLGVFSKANNIILKQYKKKHESSSLFIDSTNIVNFSGCLNFGYNIKIKNKKSLKISALVDHNKVPYILDISKGSVHDAKIMENIINNNKKKINLVGDKGYIKNEIYIKQIKDKHNITLITPLRVNSKKKIVINTDNEYENSETQINLLNDRFNVEQLIYDALTFVLCIKKSYKRISSINDKTLTLF